MKWLAFCIKRGVGVTVGVLLAVLAGGIAIVEIPRQLTPEVEVPVIGVRVVWLGASPQDVEREIIEPMEEQLNAVEGVREITSTARMSEAEIRMEFDWGTDLDVASIDVNNKLNLVEELPEEAAEPIIFFGEPRGHAIAYISLRGKGETADDLKEYAEDVLEPELKRLEGVSQVDVFGGRERQVEATFDPFAIAAYRLTPRDLGRILEAWNENTRGGVIDQGKYGWTIRTEGEFRTAEDVENVVLRRGGREDLVLGEILDVTKDAYKDAQAFVRIDGQPGIVFAVQKKTGANVVAVIGRIRDKVGELNAEVLKPLDRRMEIVYNEATYVDRSMNQLKYTVILCAVLAGGVLIVFLRNIRALLTVFLTIPVAFITTFVVLWVLGRTLNIVSLAGLAFAVGMLVDNSIVVLENIFRHRQMGKSAFKSALDGAGEVWGAVLASTATTVAVFVPILLIEEEAGQLFRDIALAIAASVGLSLVASLTVIPMLTSRFLKTRDDEEAEEVGPARLRLRLGAVRAVRIGGHVAAALLALVLAAVLALLVVSTLSAVGVLPEMHEVFGVGQFSMPGMTLGELGPSRVLGILMVVAFFVVVAELPNICRRLDRHYDDDDSGYLGDEALKTTSTPVYLAALLKRGLTMAVRWLMEKRWRRGAAAGIILVGFAYLLIFFAFLTPTTYLPTGNRNFVFGFVMTEAGASVAHNRTVALDIEDRVRGLPEVENFFIVAMREQIFFGVKATTGDVARELSARVAAALGSTIPPFAPPFAVEGWFKKNSEYLRTPIAGIRPQAQQLPLFQREGTLAGQTISINVRGEDIDRLHRIGEAVKERLERVRGVQFVLPSYKLGGWELRPTPDVRRASAVGLTSRDVGYDVLAMVNGIKVDDFREPDGNELDLTLRGLRVYNRQTALLGEAPMWTPDGVIQLKQVAPVQMAPAFSVIEHTQQQRSISLETALQPGAAMSEVLAAVRDDVVAPLERTGAIPPEYIVDLRGTAGELERMLDELSWSLVLALVIVYLLMAALFESFAHPIVIMLSVPLAVVGGFIMLWLITGYNMALGIPPPQLDVVTMLGFVILIGIVVNNAILVVAQALNFHEIEGIEIKKAIVESVESRVRPIFMSTTTSVLGMLPLVVIPGPGTELYQGLGAVVVGGLAIATVFTLILTPVLFSFAYDWTERIKALAVRAGLLVAGGEETESEKAD